MKGNERRLSRLLAGSSHLSVLEKEQMLRTVLKGEQETEERSFAHGIGLRWLLAAVALVAMVAVPLYVWRSATTPTGVGDDAFLARGVASGEVPRVELLCDDRDAGDGCQPGQTLLFELGSSAGATHFAALAQKDGGAAIWYFPAGDEGSSLQLAGNTRHGMLAHGVELGPEHTAGRYTVYAVFSARALSRTDIKACFETQAEQSPCLHVVERELVVR